MVARSAIAGVRLAHLVLLATVGGQRSLFTVSVYLTNQNQPKSNRCCRSASIF